MDCRVKTILSAAPCFAEISVSILDLMDCRVKTRMNAFAVLADISFNP